MVIMKLVFVTGLAGIDRRTIIDLALQRAARKDKFKVIDLEVLNNVLDDVKGVKDLETARNILSNFYGEVERIMITGLKEQKENIILNGSFTLDTAYGYVMSVPEDFFRSFKPDNIVILEKETSEGDYKTDEHQRINRHYGTLYSSMCGSFLKIIKFREKRMMDAVNQLSEVIKH